MTYAELAARMLPYAGGEYVYIRGAYGDLPAFLYMWTWFAVAKPASIATVTIGLARTLALFPSLQVARQHGHRHAHPVALVTALRHQHDLAHDGLNYLGIRRAANFQLVFTGLKVVLVLVIAITCLCQRHGLAANFGTVFTGAEGGFAGFMVALIAALWAYDGWNDLNMVAGEVRNPERNAAARPALRRLGIVGFLYISVNAAIQYMLPAVTVAASPRPAVTAVSVVARPDSAPRSSPQAWHSAFLSRSTAPSCPARASPSPPRAIVSFSSSSRAEPALRNAVAVARVQASAQHAAAACLWDVFSSSSNWPSSPSGSST